MKQVLLGLILVFCCGAIQSQTIFNPSDVIVNYNSGAASGSSANPNIPWGLNITRWVRTPKMSWNTDRYKCYMIGNVPFRLRYPDTYVPGANDGKKYPVMLFWHGGGEANPNTYDNEFQLFNGGQTFPQKITDGGQDAFILFPQSRNSGWDNSYFTLMNVVIDSLIKNCKGDEDRVLSMGLSIGGTASFDYALAYPKRASTIIANSPVFIDTYNSSFGPAVHIPLWLGSGGQDVNPTPTAVQNFVNAYNNTGGNLYWSFYPTRGHVMWDYQWAEEPNYGDRMRTTHKANPLVYFNNRFFCPGSPVSSRMGITPGFFAYQWDKNGTTIGGAVSNEYIATDFGTYRARFKRTSSSDWSAWSLAPAVISPVCPPVSGTGTGLKGTYYNNINVTTPSVLTRTDAAFNFIWDENVSPGSPVAGQNFSIKWTGKIQPQFSETYTIYTRTDDGVRLWINGVQLINNYTDHSSTEDFGSITLAGGQKYDIRIEYYNKGGGGLAYLKWSSPSTVKQMIPTKQLYPDGTGDPDVPLCATNTLPANGAVTATSTTAVLSWSNVLNATSYDVYLWTGATPPASPTAANVATNTYSASGLSASALYNWYVVPKNAGGSATGCITNNKTTFTTAGVPVCAVNTLPANASTIATATTAALSWGAVANATSYDVYLWTGVTPPASPTATNITTNTFNASNLIGSTLYNWYVIPKNAIGPAAGCDASNKTTFTTATIIPVPGCTVNSSPANGSTIATQTNAALVWAPAATATSYDVYIWTGLTPPASPTINTTTASYTVSGLSPSTLYNWYIAPKNASGAATICGSTNATVFTTAAVVIPVPGCTSNTSPLNGTTIATQSTATLTWNTVAAASSYDVYLWTGATAPVSPTATNVSGNIYTATGLSAASLYNWYVVPKNASGPATGCDINNKTSFITAVTVPACATNTAPLNGTTIATQSTATLSWNTVATAASYDLYLWTGATPPVSPTVTDITSTTYNATGLTASSLYNWYVVPKNVSGPATGCDVGNKTTFITAAPVPQCADNLLPANGATLATQTSVTLSWNSAATATSYDVYLWKGATPPASPTATIPGTAFGTSGLDGGTLYNWYVVPKNAIGSAIGCDLSNKSTFTTAVLTLPVCATQNSPVNGDTIFTQTSALLIWDFVNNAASYDVYIWTGATAPASPTANVSSSNSYNATNLSPLVTYKWYVIPKNAIGSATDCTDNTLTFTTAPAPVATCAVNRSPVNGSTIATSATAILAWDPVPMATIYDVYLWTGATPPATPTAIINTNTYNAAGLSASSLYNWYVIPRNVNSAAVGCATDVINFTTATIAVPPACAINISPASGAMSGSPTNVTLTWGAVPGATSYDVYLWSGATPPASPTNTVSIPTFSTGGLTAATLYSWYVVPKNAIGAAIGCATSATAFTTASVVVPVPGCANNIAPANNSTIETQNLVTLTWDPVASATSYDVYISGGATALTSANTTSTTVSFGGLFASTLYTWYVVPKNAGGSAIGCDVSNKSSFTTAAIPVPACVSNTAPANGAILLSQTTATLSWPLASTATSYDVYLWTGAIPPAAPTANVTSTSYNATNLIPASLYNWYIAPRNASGAATICGSNNATVFTTAAIPVPGCTSNTAPVNGSTILTQATATLTWNTIAAATSYDVYLWTGATAPVTPTANSVIGNTYNATSLTAGTLYNWYVIPKNASGPANGCDLSNKTTFTTAATPVQGCTSNTAPVNGSTILTQATATLTWNTIAAATSYDVYLWTGATAPVTPTATSVTGNTYNASSLNAGTLYNWYIVPKNASGPATGCDLSNKTSFTTAAVVIPAPACVTNTAPVNGAAIATQTTATLTWNAAATATSYDVYIWAGAVAPVTPTANITGTSYNAISLIASTLYNWYIAPKNASGAASGCATTNRTSFTTASSTPTPGAGTGLQGVYYNGITLTGTPLLTRIDPVINFDSYGSPGPGVPADQYSVRWTGQVKPLYTETYTFYTTADDGIRLWVNGTQLVNNFVAQGATERSGSIAMVAGQKYDIIIEYFEGSGGAVSRLSWSGARTPKAVVPQSQLFPPGFVDPTIPTCAANTAPANGSTIASASAATLSWNAVPDASSYDVYIWTGATPSATPTANTTNTSYNATALTASTLYNWYVVPKNVIGTPAGCISNSTTFNTGVPPPACTINLLPVNNAILATSSTAAITWTAAATATSYDVYIWTGATAPVTPTANLNAASYNAAGLTAATTYNWYVSPRNASGAAIGCSTNKTAFVTAAPPAPSCTVNTLPANGVTIATQITATLSWNPAPNATSYDVYVWTGATPPASPTANITASTYAASGLIAATSYNWYVTPKNATGTAAGCNANASRFTTAAAPPSNLLGYVKVSTDPYTACADASSTGRTAVYGSSIANGSILYTGPALTTAFNGGWNWYSFTPVPGGPVTVTFAVYPTGGILMLRTCANGGARIAAEANATTVEQDIAALKVIRETAEAAAPRRPVIAAVVTGSIMYPNPVVNGQAARLQINSDKTGVAVVNIINSNGFIISTRKVNLVAGMNAATVNTASLGKGLYIVNITGGTKPTNIKLLVE